MTSTQVIHLQLYHGLKITPPPHQLVSSSWPFNVYSIESKYWACYCFTLGFHKLL